MTQEELDSIMDSDIDELDLDGTQSEEQRQYDNMTKSYTLDPTKAWPPPPPSSENKVVHQLDDVTKESEDKATQLFDMLDAISSISMDVQEELTATKESINSISKLLDKLTVKFPDMEIFANELNKSQDSISAIDSSLSKIEEVNGYVMEAMDTMQYQDIHRQKIERVVNIMRTLSNYMNKLFEGRIDDDKRVSSAKHIHGDENDNLVEDDDIEALIATFGKNKPYLLADIIPENGLG